MASQFIEHPKPLTFLDRKVVVDPTQHLALVKNPSSECDHVDDSVMDGAGLNLLAEISKRTPFQASA